MKTKLLKWTGLLIAFVFIFSLFSQTVAAPVWDDNFDDGNLDGWTEVEPIEPSYAFDYIVTDGAVYADSGDNFNAYTWLTHPSAVTEGQWSFDFYQPVPTSAYNIQASSFIVMANGTPDDMEGYGIAIAPMMGEPPIISLSKWEGAYYDYGCKTNFEVYTHDVDTAGTWVSFDVTCESGEMNVFMDDEHILNCSGITYENSSMLIFTIGPNVGMVNTNVTGYGFDNVVVDDEITTFTTTTATSTPTTTTATTGTGTGIDPTLLIVAAGAAGVVIIVAIVFLKRR